MAKKNPYLDGNDENFWRRSVGNVAPAEVDPVGKFRLTIDPEMKVATAGSCFAQHIARYLKASGFNYYIAEPGHAILPEKVREANNYGLFSARYGNIYTARQLLQLMQRAYGLFKPKEDVWKEEKGVVLDPFRPTSQPGGFVSEFEMRTDREQHLAAVREMFETLDVFVFTLGLTECWVSRSDGAVFPVCPGVSGGEFDPDKHEFVNESVDDVVDEMSSFLMLLARVNPSAQVILTVSPVPLMATARRDQHVLTATTYSKSVLRVAAEMLTQRFHHVHYFPSYEVITGNFNRGQYYADNLRDVVEDGVSHVMGLFMKHATSHGESAVDRKKRELAAKKQVGEGQKDRAAQEKLAAEAKRLVEVECDEVALDQE